MRRGTEATWQSPSGSRRRRKGHGHVAVRPHNHVRARVGHHVEAGNREDMTKLIRESTPLFNRVLSLYFFRVGLCSHTILFIAGDVATRRASDRGGNPRSHGRSPRDQQLRHVLKIGISDGSPDHTWMRHKRSIVVPISSRFIGRSWSSAISEHHADTSGWSNSASKDWTVDRASRRTTIDAWSWPDRRVIAARFVRNRGAFSAKVELWHRGIEDVYLQLHQMAFDQESTAQSTLDRSPIAARSRSDRAAIGALFEAKSWLIPNQYGSYVLAKWNRLHDALIPPPRPHQSATIFGPIFLFKSMYFPPLFFNFWSTREEIKQVSRKVLGSRDPLLPRV